MAGRGWTVGVDFGGTNIKIGLVSDAGRVALVRILATRAHRCPQAFVEGVSRVVEELAQQAAVRPSQLRGVGVGAPGLVNGARGLIHTLVNVPGWREVPLGRQLARRLRCRCVVDNDVNCVALGEWRFGAARGARALVCLTLGTGVGGGLVLNGQLYRGVTGAAGELGHMVIDPDGPRCGCGSRGCLEAHVGSAAIGRLARQKRFRQAGGRLTPELMARAARAGDAVARQVWRSVGCSLGIGVGSLINVFNPDRVVIGGGVSNAWSLFAPTMMRTIRAQAMTIPARAARVVRARLGDRAGILGAAVLVWSDLGGMGHGVWGVGGRRTRP